MRIDIMTDIETLGTEVDSTIFQIAAIAFDLETGEHIAEFNQIADISIEKDINVTGDTLLWWMNTNKELFSTLLNKGEISTRDILVNFHLWLEHLESKGELYLWGNGILFDNKMLEHQFTKMGLRYPIHYRNDRDVRTIVELAAAKLGISERELKERFNDENLTAHDAFDDVKYQIKLVSWCYNLLVLDLAIKEVENE